MDVLLPCLQAGHRNPGGRASQRRTGLRGGFPAIREKNREFRENRAVWQMAKSRPSERSKISLLEDNSLELGPGNFIAPNREYIETSRDLQRLAGSTARERYDKGNFQARLACMNSSPPSSRTLTASGKPSTANIFCTEVFFAGAFGIMGRGHYAAFQMAGATTSQNPFAGILRLIAAARGERLAKPTPLKEGARMKRFRDNQSGRCGSTECGKFPLQWEST
jgi:hypothetical protein